MSVYEISIVYIQECKLVKKYVYFFFTCDQLIELSVHLKICILIRIFNKKFIWKGVVMIYQESNMESRGKYDTHSLAGKEE